MTFVFLMMSCSFSCSWKYLLICFLFESSMKEIVFSGCDVCWWFGFICGL